MSIKMYVILAAVLVLIAAESFALWKAYSDGETKAQAREVKAAQIQAAKDQVNAKKTVDSLQAELAGLRHTPPPAVVRCTTRRVPKAKPTTGDTGSPAASGSVQPVPEGTGEQPDLGPSLRLLAQACDIVSARDRAAIEWANRK